MPPTKTKKYAKAYLFFMQKYLTNALELWYNNIIKWGSIIIIYILYLYKKRYRIYSPASSVSSTGASSSTLSSSAMPASVNVYLVKIFSCASYNAFAFVT